MSSFIEHQNMHFLQKFFTELAILLRVHSYNVYKQKKSSPKVQFSTRDIFAKVFLDKTFHFILQKGGAILGAVVV
jgi:hypothetical protein